MKERGGVMEKEEGKEKYQAWAVCQIKNFEWDINYAIPITSCPFIPKGETEKLKPWAIFCYEEDAIRCKQLAEGGYERLGQKSELFIKKVTVIL